MQHHDKLCHLATTQFAVPVQVCRIAFHLIRPPAVYHGCNAGQMGSQRWVILQGCNHHHSPCLITAPYPHLTYSAVGRTAMGDLDVLDCTSRAKAVSTNVCHSNQCCCQGWTWGTMCWPSVSGSAGYQTLYTHPCRHTLAYL